MFCFYSVLNLSPDMSEFFILTTKLLESQTKTKLAQISEPFFEAFILVAYWPMQEHKKVHQIPHQHLFYCI